MKSGGQLSRGAVATREYGLPAVAGIAGATQLLHDGQVLVLDGLSGTVTVLSPNRYNTVSPFTRCCVWALLTPLGYTRKLCLHL